MIKVSVILPVYGVAEYIEKCVNSLLRQTLNEIEFLFVDDHGPDDSIAIAQHVVAGHPREAQFRFLRPEHNLGAGMARNFALEQAQGEYVAFVDPDDWVEPDMFFKLYQAAKTADNSDLCCCLLQKDYTDGRPSETVGNPIVPQGEFTHENKAYFLTHYVSLFATFLFRRELLNSRSIRFPEERSADDSFFVSAALFTAMSIAYVNRPFYHYLIRPGSVTTTKVPTKYQKRLAVFAKLVQFAKDSGVYDEYKAEIDFLYIKKGGLSAAFSYVSNAETADAHTLQQILNSMEQVVPNFRNNPYLKQSLPLRTLIGTMSRTPHLACRVIKLYVKRAKPIV